MRLMLRMPGILNNGCCVMDVCSWLVLRQMALLQVLALLLPWCAGVPRIAGQHHSGTDNTFQNIKVISIQEELHYRLVISSTDHYGQVVSLCLFVGCLIIINLATFHCYCLSFGVFVLALYLVLQHFSDFFDFVCYIFENRLCLTMQQHYVEIQVVFYYLGAFFENMFLILVVFFAQSTCNIIESVSVVIFHFRHSASGFEDNTCLFSVQYVGIFCFLTWYVSFDQVFNFTFLF